MTNTFESCRQHFFPIASSIWEKLNWKASPLVKSEILGLFFKTLTANDKYSCHKMEKFPQANQMPLSKKNIFYGCFISVVVCTSTCQIVSFVLVNLRWKTSFLVRSEILKCLLRHWLPMTSILIIKENRSRKLFKSTYLKNQKCFISFLLHLLNLHEIFSILKNRMRLRAQLITKIIESGKVRLR